jgi:hypothetical protein
MNETYKELTKALYKARIESQVADNELKSIRDTFEAEVKPKKETAKQLAKAAEDAKTALTDYAKEAYQTSTLDDDGPVKMNNSTEIVIDEVKAMAWARVKMPDAIIETLDMATLKLLAEKHPEWATVTKGKKPIVATDLSKFVES